MKEKKKKISANCLVEKLERDLNECQSNEINTLNTEEVME